MLSKLAFRLPTLKQSHLFYQMPTKTTRSLEFIKILNTRPLAICNAIHHTCISVDKRIKNKTREETKDRTHHLFGQNFRFVLGDLSRCFTVQYPHTRVSSLSQSSSQIIIWTHTHIDNGLSPPVNTDLLRNLATTGKNRNR